VSSDKPQARSDHPVQEVLPETFSNYSDHPKPKKSKTEIAFEKKQKCELAFVTGVNPHFVNGKPSSAGFREFQTVFKNHGKNLKPWINFSHSSFLRDNTIEMYSKVLTSLRCIPKKVFCVPVPWFTLTITKSDPWSVPFVPGGLNN